LAGKAGADHGLPAGLRGDRGFHRDHSLSGRLLGQSPGAAGRRLDIGRSWGLDPREIDALAGLPLHERGHPLTLAEIAEMRGVAVEDLIAEVEAAIATLRTEADEARDEAGE
jgi:hypothetical protein